MKLETRGIREVQQFLLDLAQHAPQAARQGVQAGLEVIQAEILQELAQDGPKVVARKNNKYSTLSVGRRMVAAVFPGLHSVGWIAVIGLEAGGVKQRKRFPAEASALQLARQYAEQLRRAEGEAEFTIAVKDGPDGADGTLTAEREDDDAVQRAWDAAETAAIDAVEEEIRKTMET
jgi:hypothetical protein